MLYHHCIYFSPGSVWSALKTVAQFCIKIPSFCLLLQSAIKYAEGNTGMFPRYHGSNKTCNRGVFLEKATTTFPLTPPQALSSPYDIPLFPFLVLVKNINQKYVTDCMLKFKEITGGVDETEGKMPHLEEQHFMVRFVLAHECNTYGLSLKLSPEPRVTSTSTQSPLLPHRCRVKQLHWSLCF